MPRPLPDYVPREIADVVLRKWPDRRLKGLAQATGIGYPVMIKFFSRDQHITFLNFENLADACQVDMDTLAGLLTLPEPDRRQRIKALIHENYGSIQDLHRNGVVTDTFVESLFRGDVGAKIVEEYVPLRKALGLTLNELAIIIRNQREVLR